MARANVRFPFCARTHVEEKIKKTADEALKLLLKHVADDEKKHHKTMETILKKAFEMGP